MKKALTFLFTTALLVLIGTTAHAATAVTQKPVSYGFKAATTPRTIDTVIVHATYNPGLKTQTLAGAMTLWKQYDVAPHYAIDRAGKVYQLVAEKNIAWHAGVSALPNGETDLNTRSVGIELIYSDKEVPTAAQYKSLQSLITDLEGRYTIKYVLGHDQIAPGRKTDPWNFDYSKVLEVFKPGTTAFPVPATLSSTIFQGEIKELTDAQQTVMKQYSYKPSCPVPLSDLRTVTVSYVDFNGVTQQGTLVVNKSIASSTLESFKSLFDLKFPIKQIVPIDSFQGSDPLSMAVNNTSAFNCRSVAGTSVFSEHSYGTAIDINPEQNPYTSKSVPLDMHVKGAFHPLAVKALTDHGLKWGGNWTSKKDYQHFSLSGK